MDPSDLQQQLKQLIVEELDLRDRRPEEIGDDTPLFGSGLGLDSLDALQLAMAVEERFGVRLPEGEAARPVFASVATLAAHIRQSPRSEP
ncbi:MAG: phosphopantetheine-binding protein [Polyangiaceae bacterium]